MKMHKFITAAEKYLILFGIASLVVFTWQLLEIIMLGEKITNDVDTVIVIVLSYSLYGNYNYLKLKNMTK